MSLMQRKVILFNTTTKNWEVGHPTPEVQSIVWGGEEGKRNEDGEKVTRDLVLVKSSMPIMKYQYAFGKGDGEGEKPVRGKGRERWGLSCSVN